MTPDVLIQAEDLATALAATPPGDPAAPVVLDPRWNLTGPDGYEEFCAGHLPGARFVDLEGELSGPAGTGGRHPLPPFQQFAHAMRRVGLDADTDVVITDGGSTLPAARLWWMLTDAGHERVRVLDGGLAAWRTAGLPIATGPAQEVAPGGFSGSPGHRRIVDAEELQQWLDRGQGVVVDVRAADRFRGESETIDPVAGHIPGALNAPATQSFGADGRFVAADALRQRFDRLGLGSDAVVYCGSGITACQTLLALQIAGVDDATLFPGSWSGWITDPSRPVATGAH